VAHRDNPTYLEQARKAHRLGDHVTATSAALIAIAIAIVEPPAPPDDATP